MRQALNKIEMKEGENPAKLYEQLAAVSNRFWDVGAIAEVQQIAVILNAAPKTYHEILTGERLRHGNALTVEHLRVAMNLHWRIIGGENQTKEEGSELVLSAFSGICFRCNKQGHKAHQCQSGNNGKGNSGKKKFNGKCNLCGTRGHKEKDCWHKEENASQRPKNWKSNKLEQANAAVDANNGNSGVEFMLSMMDKSFPADHRMLMTHKIWIADTGATVHSTPHACGLVEGKKATEEDAIMVGDGSSMGAATIGNIKGMIVDKYG